jgi:hypothetical protein
MEQKEARDVSATAMKLGVVGTGDPSASAFLPTNSLVVPLLTDLYELTMAYAYWKVPCVMHTQMPQPTLNPPFFLFHLCTNLCTGGQARGARRFRLVLPQESVQGRGHHLCRTRGSGTEGRGARLLSADSVAHFILISFNLELY